MALFRVALERMVFGREAFARAVVPLALVPRVAAPRPEIARVLAPRAVVARPLALSAALTLFAVLVARLITLNGRSAAVAAAARQNPNFESFNAGFGWGAWLMALGLILVLLGFLVGALRELDLRRGLPE